MSKTGTFSGVMSIGGLSIKNSQLSKTADGDCTREVALAAGKAGTLSTRTGDGEGIITLTAGHGLSTADVVDIHWTGGVRYGVTLDADAETTVGFDDTPAAGGDVLPAEGTAVVVAVRQQINIAIDGDNVAMFGIHSDQVASVVMEDADGDVIKAWHLGAGAPEFWWSETADTNKTNPLTGDPITVAYATNGSTTAGTLQIVALQDSTP